MSWELKYKGVYRYCECPNGKKDHPFVVPNYGIGADICTHCGGVIRYEDKFGDDEPDISEEELQRDEYSKKAWDCYMDFKHEDALHYIDLALDLDGDHSNNWNRKAIILESLGRYPESEECYDRSLELSFNNLVCDNKVRMLYDWASELIEDSETLLNGLEALGKAKEINTRAIAARPGQNSEEDIDKYLRQRDTINYRIGRESEYQRNLEILRAYPKEELFTITGMQFYENDVGLAPGTSLRLVREPENVHDRDAIAVYAGDEKIGYVANGTYTKSEYTSSASEMQDKIRDTTRGSYLLCLERYVAIQFHIGKIIK